MELELYLNPSEKDHRLLMLIIRAFVISEVKIAIDNNLQEFTKNELAAMPKVLKNIIMDREVPTEKDDENGAISYIVKLSHVILKREWERVRSTK